MGRKDLVWLAFGFVLVGALTLIAILFPVYGVYQNPTVEPMVYVRCPIWNPPNLYAGPIEADWLAPGVDLASGAEVMPGNIKATPIFFDSRLHRVFGVAGERKNMFGSLTVYLMIAYLMFATWKWSWRG